MNSDVQDLHVLPTTFPTRLACDLCALPCEGRGGLGRGAFGDQPEPRAPPSSLPLPSQGEGPRQMPQSSTRSGGSGGASPSSPHTSRHMKYMTPNITPYSTKIGHASLRERVCQYVLCSVLALTIKQKK